MRLARTVRIKGEGAAVFLIIILLIVGGGVWWLYMSRASAEKNARIFATEVVKRVVLNYDGKYLHLHLGREAQAQYLTSWRDRLIDQFKEWGTPAQPLDVQGGVAFTSYFFDPHGTFRTRLVYPNTSATLELDISRGMTAWQVDTINVIWDPPPQPTPTPAPVPTPSPSPTPDPKRKNKTG